MATPRVSVAVPVYNGEKYLAQCLDSMLAQSFGDFELLISDNASTDGTEALCRRYEALDRRVRYTRRERNVGGPANFCQVFALGTAPYHKWCTADDYCHPDYLREAVAVLDSEPDVVLCYARTRLIDAEGQALLDYDDNLDLDDPSPRARFLELYRRLGLCHAQLGLIRRDAMRKTRLFAGHLACDADFLGELALVGKFRLLPQIRFYRRMHRESSSWLRASDEYQQGFYGRAATRGMHTWRRLAFQFGAVARSEVGFADKLGLFGEVARRTGRNRHILVPELMDALQHHRQGSKDAPAAS
jgi:glycosyltransferase involved in cell wall biosynthesis